MPANDSRAAWPFRLEMIPLPADDARQACFLLHRTATSGLNPISDIPLGLSPRALFRASSVCLGARKQREEALRTTSSPHQKSRRSCFTRAPSRSQFGESFLSQASTSFNLKTRKHEVLATPTLLRIYSQNGSEVAHASPHRCPWAHIARQLLSRCDMRLPHSRSRDLIGKFDLAKTERSSNRCCGTKRFWITHTRTNARLPH